MTDWPHAKWIPEDIEVQLERAFVNGRRAGEAAALEEAAKVAEGYSSTLGRVIAVAIRALKVATPPPPDPRA